MVMRSTASTIDGIEIIPCMTGEIFNIHNSVMVRHARDKLGIFVSREGQGLPCAADGKTCNGCATS